MLAIIGWIIGLSASVAALVMLAEANSHLLHLLLSGTIAALIAFAAYRTNSCELSTKRLSRSKLASINAVYMTLIWGWGAVALAATYLAIPELQNHNWWRKEWWQFVGVFGGAAVLSAIFAYVLNNDQSPDGTESTLAKWARYLAIAQLVAMIATMLGLIIDGKMDFGWIDWSANNIFFTGAAGLALLSWIALRTQKALSKA